MSYDEERFGPDTPVRTEIMQNPMMYLALALSGGANHAATETEVTGQKALVRSNQLPVEVQGDGAEEALMAMGFEFGDPDERDPLFRPAKLPEGWSKRACESPLLTDIVDGDGVKRVAVFYKPAFYDRYAYMYIAPPPRPPGPVFHFLDDEKTGRNKENT